MISSSILSVMALLLVTPPASAEGARGYDSWVYLKHGNAVSIVYNDAPIRFLPEVGDGAFDRPINITPERRYVLMDSRLSLEDAAGIVMFWNAFDPKRATEFVVISGNLRFAFPARPNTVDVPEGLLARAREYIANDGAKRGTPK